jgi:cardiolipin synthase
MRNEIIFQDGKAYFDHIMADIDHAKQSIDIEIYVFRMDDLGTRLVTHLIAAAKRNVKIRILVDGAGTTWWHGPAVANLEKSGIHTKVFRPLPWQLWQWRRSVSRLSFLLKLGYFILNINARTHKKVFIIDGRITYIGSFNIDQCHLGTAKTLPWRDTGVRLEDADIELLSASFENSWDPSKATFSHPKRFSRIRLNHSRQARRALYKSLLRKIGKCQKRIWITNAYFVPNTMLLQQLKNAASRGVDVRILLPRHSDVPMMTWASRAFYFDLLRAKVRIYEYLPSMLHAKTILLDDQALVGTSNLNHRSLLHDLEVDVHLENPYSTQVIADSFEKDLEKADAITLEQMPRPWYQRVLGQCLCLTRYFL